MQFQCLCVKYKQASEMIAEQEYLTQREDALTPLDAGW